jgi:hypothetical protein
VTRVHFYAAAAAARYPQNITTGPTIGLETNELPRGSQNIGNVSGANRAPPRSRG